jgi:hypothetical protein
MTISLKARKWPNSDFLLVTLMVSASSAKS